MSVCRFEGKHFAFFKCVCVCVCVCAWVDGWACFHKLYFYNNSSHNLHKQFFNHRAALNAAVLEATQSCCVSAVLSVCVFAQFEWWQMEEY